MLSFKTESEISQIKHFILIYYKPLLSTLEIEQLTASSKEYIPVHQDLQKTSAENCSRLAEPKDPECSKKKKKLQQNILDSGGTVQMWPRRTYA